MIVERADLQRDGIEHLGVCSKSRSVQSRSVQFARYSQVLLRLLDRLTRGLDASLCFVHVKPGLSHLELNRRSQVVESAVGCAARTTQCRSAVGWSLQCSVSYRLPVGQLVCAPCRVRCIRIFRRAAAWNAGALCFGGIIILVLAKLALSDYNFAH